MDENISLCVHRTVLNILYISNFLYITPTNIPLYNCLIYSPVVVIIHHRSNPLRSNLPWSFPFIFLCNNFCIILLHTIKFLFQIDLFDPQWFRTKCWHRCLSSLSCSCPLALSQTSNICKLAIKLADFQML